MKNVLLLDVQGRRKKKYTLEKSAGGGETEPEGDTDRDKPEGSSRGIGRLT